MTDRYQALRDAIAAGPTPGPWYSMTTVRYNGYSIRHRTGDPKQPMIPIAIVNRRHPASDANRDLIRAADPDTIRALLQERDALREALQEVVRVQESGVEVCEWAASMIKAHDALDCATGGES